MTRIISRITQAYKDAPIELNWIGGPQFVTLMKEALPTRYASVADYEAGLPVPTYEIVSEEVEDPKL